MFYNVFKGISFAMRDVLLVEYRARLVIALVMRTDARARLPGDFEMCINQNFTAIAHNNR